MSRSNTPPRSFKNRISESSGGRLLANRHIVQMPFGELTVCLIIDEAEGEKNVGDWLILECSLFLRERGASYRKDINKFNMDLSGKISVRRNFGTYRFCFGGR